MAINDDTFWAEHAPAGAEGPYLPGLRLHRVVEENYRKGLGLTVAFSCGILCFFLLWSFTGWSPVLPSLLTFVAVGGLSATPAFCGAKARYRLLDDNSDMPEFGGRPEKLPALLEKLAVSDRLRARLTPPEVEGPPHSAFWTLYPPWDGIRPVAMVAFWGFVLGQALVVIDGFLVTGNYSPVAVLSLASLAVLLIPIGWMYHRVRKGVSMLGTGDPFSDLQRPPAQFRDASAAILRWDPLLGKPYLLLELHGKYVRYYSPAQDSLHLLRVARYRMPHLALHV